MDSPLPILSLAGAAVVGTAAIFPKLRARLALSRAKHRSLTGHARMLSQVARLLTLCEYDIGEFIRSEGAPHAEAARRHASFVTRDAEYPVHFDMWPTTR